MRIKKKKKIEFTYASTRYILKELDHFHKIYQENEIFQMEFQVIRSQSLGSGAK